MKKITEILRKKQGTTMVEMMVTLLLISIMMTMAVSSLSSASHIFMQVQKTQYAQSILDTVMTELRAITKNASSYIKIYENAKNIANSTGNCDGNAIEFINEEGYAVLVSTDGCNGVQREHNKKLNNGLPILHKVPPKRDYGRYFCIMAEKGGTSHGGLTEKLSPFFHAKKQEVNAYGR